MITINQRLGLVRNREGITVRTIARRLNIPPLEYESWERVDHELTVNQLLACRDALEVPVDELLGIEDPVPNRANVIRAYKSAMTLLEICKGGNQLIILSRLISDLEKVMPELKGTETVYNSRVKAWPAIGQRRSPNEMSRTEELSIDDGYFQAPVFAHTI